MKEESKYFDIEIIKRLQNGDQNAFDEIYQYYHKQVYYFAMQYFHDEEKAKDIVQDTFLAIHKYIRNLESPEAFYVWMKKINYSCCVKKYSKEKKDSSYFTNDFESQEVENMDFSSNVMSVEEEVFYKDLKETIIDILSTMDSDFKVVGYLRFFEELSTKEISQILDIPMGTVSSRINRIKAKIKGELEKRGFSQEACFSALLFPSLSNAYKMSIETLTPVPSLPPHPQASRPIQVKPKPSMASQVLSGIALTSCIVVPASFVYLSNVQQKSNEPLITNIVGNTDESKIVDITYKQEWTKEDFELEVVTSTDNFDEITLDGKPDLRVSENKVYKVALVKEGIVIDEKTVDIKNVDKDTPEVSIVEYDDDKAKIIFEDVGCGLDFASLQVSSNGIRITDIEVDQENHSVYIDRLYQVANLQIKDLVGNELKIKVDFIEENG